MVNAKPKKHISESYGRSASQIDQRHVDGFRN